MRRARATAFSTALVALVLTGGCGANDKPSSPPSGAARVPAVSNCGTAKPVVKPKAITLTCADANEVVQAISWEFWGTSDALGSATVTSNNCDPDCADGTNIDYPVHVMLDRVKANGAGPQFTRATVVYQGDSPMEDAAQTETSDLTLFSPSAQ